jgi:hypothetical protein
VARRTPAKPGPVQALRAFAMTLPDVEEGVACEGTAIEKRTLKVRKKAFLFLGPADLMLKLRESLPEAARLAAQAPDQYRAGAGGWVSVKFPDPATVSIDLLKKWVDESYRQFASAEHIAILATTGVTSTKRKRRRE